MTPAVEVHALAKRYGAVRALDGVDLTVPEGVIHGLIGPNGAGKSTLLRAVFGLVRPSGGTVEVLGRRHRVEGTPATLEGVAGFVDRPRFYPYLTARQTLEILARADRGAGRELVEEVLEMAGLTAVASRRIRGWSTGMLQRLGLAAALLRRPRLLILDEPTEGLDPAGARDLHARLRGLAEGGVTILVSSHDMTEVDEVCDRATILHRGRVVRTAAMDDLRKEAPAGRQRLLTTDDAVAEGVAARHGLPAAASTRGGLSLQADPDRLHRYLLDLADQGVTVVALEQEVPPLAALFYGLVDG